MHWNHEEDLAILTMVSAMVTSLIEQAWFPGEAKWIVVAMHMGVVFIELFLHDGLIEIFKNADVRVIVFFLEQQSGSDQSKGRMNR